MFLHMVSEIKLASRLNGSRRRSLSWSGLSVPRAKAPKVSIIRLTHNIMTALRGGSSPLQAAIKVTVNATAFTVNWNCKNFLMLSNVQRPQTTAWIQDAKLLSKMIISAASFATNEINKIHKYHQKWAYHSNIIQFIMGWWWCMVKNVLRNIFSQSSNQQEIIVGNIFRITLTSS